MSVFSERQKMNQLWLWILLFGALAFHTYILILQLFFDKTVGNSPSPDWLLIASFVFFLGIMVFLRAITLTTKIDETGVYMRFYPLVRKSFDWNDIQKIEVSRYSFVGYGIRISAKYGTCYNTKGNMGIIIKTQSGKKYLIGTQKPEQVKQIIQKYHHE